MLEAHERAGAVRLERDLDPAAAGPELGVAIESPGEDDPALRELDERAAGDVLAAIRPREAQPQRAGRPSIDRRLERPPLHHPVGIGEVTVHELDRCLDADLVPQRRAPPERPGVAPRPAAGFTAPRRSPPNAPRKARSGRMRSPPARQSRPEPSPPS